MQLVTQGGQKANTEEVNTLEKVLLSPTRLGIDTKLRPVEVAVTRLLQSTTPLFQIFLTSSISSVLKPTGL